jgi:hypothetical protein
MEINTMTKEFKGVDKDPIRMAEYKNRERMSLLLEQYYKLKSEHAGLDEISLLTMANKILEAKEKEVDSK